MNCSDKFQQFLIGCGPPCDHAVTAFLVRGALFDSGYIFCVILRETFGIISGFLREWVDSAPEVDSRPVLLSSWPRTSSTTAVA